MISKELGDRFNNVMRAAEDQFKAAMAEHAATSGMRPDQVDASVVALFVGTLAHNLGLHSFDFEVLALFTDAMCAAEDKCPECYAAKTRLWGPKGGKK